MDLPQSVQEIADVIGREKALRLLGGLDSCGKRNWRVCLYVPHRIRPDHPLVQALGWHYATKMVREFGGIILQPSNCRFLARRFRNASIHRMAQEGMALREIAESVQLSVRQVRNVLAEEPPEDEKPVRGDTTISVN
jgi:hypothetical protein